MSHCGIRAFRRVTRDSEIRPVVFSRRSASRAGHNAGHPLPPRIFIRTRRGRARRRR